MDRTYSAAHASHDELLIARLYGGDVDEDERARALELMADCEECAALFADLGAIAAATEAMPVSPRPRDFRLTERDAARLHRGRRVWSGVFGLGLRRSLGGSLAALGLAGVLLTGAASFLGASGSGAASLMSDQGRIANGADQAASTAGPSSGAVPGQVALPPNVAGATPAPTAAPAPTEDTQPSAVSSPPEAAQPSAATVSGGSAQDGTSGSQPPPPASPPSKAAGSGGPETAVGAGGNEAGQGPTPQAEATTQGGVDARLIWLLGFGVLFAVGLALMLLPLIPRPRRRAV
jgi:anti-sigma factor RsiW